MITAHSQVAALNPPHTEPIPPKWAFGYMQSWWGSVANDLGYGSQQGIIDHAKALRGISNQYGSHQHPADVMVLDIHWCGGNWNWPASLQWATNKFPDPKGMIDQLHAMNFKVMMCYHALEGVTDQWLALVKRDLEYGLDVPWLDFWYMDADEARVHAMLSQYRGNKRELMMLRHYARPNSESGEANRAPSDPNPEKRMTMHWTGDIKGTWLGFQESIEAITYGVDGAIGGWSYLGVDCPGHIGMPDLELTSRWIQFCDFTTMTRNHGTDGGRDVWSWGPVGEENSRFSRMLRYRLLPYIYTYSREIWDKGIPLTRPMKLAYPGELDSYKYQYMFGRELLVAPVWTNNNQYMNVVLPKSHAWIDYWTKQEYAGGTTVKVDIKKDNYRYIPLFIRKGSIIPMGPEVHWIDPKTVSDPLTLDIYPDTPGTPASFTLYDDDGETKDYQTGAYALTKIEFTSDRNNVIRLFIAPMQGTYTGKPAERTWIAKINLQNQAPSAMYVSGTALPRVADHLALVTGTQGTGWAYDAATRTVYVKARSSTSQPLTFSSTPQAVSTALIPVMSGRARKELPHTAFIDLERSSTTVGKGLDEYYDIKGKLLENSSAVKLRLRKSID